MSEYEGSDSELDRAIALSLQDIGRATVIDLLSDDDDDDDDDNGDDNDNDNANEDADLHAPSSTRRAPVEGSSASGPASRHAEVGVAAFDNAATTKGSGMAGVDRKRMEEERLARVRKRKAVSISPPPLSRAVGRPPSSLSSTLTGVGPDWHSGKKGKTDQRLPLSRHNLVAEKESGRNSGSEGRAAVFLVPQSLIDSKPTTLREARLDLSHETHERASREEECDIACPPDVLSYIQQQNLLAPGIHFPNGIVRKTWVHGCPRQDDIKIEEVLQKDDLELAVLSAYQWDDEWILRKINLKRTKVVCVVQAETEAQKAQMCANVPPNIRFCFPSMDGQVNCMHAKLQLLSHPTHLRIVVPSANLVPYDWGEDGGIMENIVFIIDLPRLPNMQRITMGEITPFGRELMHFLEAIGMEEGVKASILNFDFSRTCHIAFIHSIGGSHSGTDWKRTGYCGLGSAIQELGLGTGQAIKIDVVSASIGNLTESFLQSIYLAAQGDDGTTELNWRTSKAPRSKTASKQLRREISNTELLVSKGVENGFRLYFPSRETVASSKGGLGAGGTICFQHRWFDSPTFPRSIMRDCKSKRPGLLIHSKMIFVRPRTPLGGSSKERTKECVAWAYLGSANLSESAWGRLSKDKTTKQPKLNIRNWECGVVVPVLRQTRASNVGTEGRAKGVDRGRDGCGDGSPGMDVFDGIIPVPMVLPGEEYGKKRPWFYGEPSRPAGPTLSKRHEASSDEDEDEDEDALVQEGLVKTLFMKPG